MMAAVIKWKKKSGQLHAKGQQGLWSQPAAVWKRNSMQRWGIWKGKFEFFVGFFQQNLTVSLWDYRAEKEKNGSDLVHQIVWKIKYLQEKNEGTSLDPRRPLSYPWDSHFFEEENSVFWENL